MKLSDYAKKIGVTYRTAWNWFKAGTINGAYQLPSGTVVSDIADDSQKYGVILYTRTSSSSKAIGGICYR